MQSVFVILAKLIASKLLFVKSFFVIILAGMVARLPVIVLTRTVSVKGGKWKAITSKYPDNPYPLSLGGGGSPP